MTDWRTIIQQEIIAARNAIRGQRIRTGSGGGGGPVSISSPTVTDAVHVQIDFSAVGTHTIVTGVPGMRIAVYELMIWNVAAQDLELLDGADSLTGPLDSFPATSGIYLPNVGEPHFKLQLGNSFAITLSAATQVSGFALYRMVEA